MTQVSLYGDFPMDLNLELNENESDHDDENQKEEIKKGLEAFGDETFDFGSDYDEDDSSQNESRCSSVLNGNNNNSGISVTSNTEKETSGSKHEKMNGGVRFGALINGENDSRNSPSPSNPFFNGLNLNMLPNSVMDSSPESLGFSPGNLNGILGTSSRPPAAPLVNGHGNKLNGNLINGNGNNSILKNSLLRPKKQVTIVEQSETIREQDEIEERNPTISIHHKEHCPRMEKDGHFNDDMWLAAERTDEQMKTMLQIRERQIQQGEQQIAKLQKDKRALNHQIGLMKTEMVQMTSRMEEFDTYKKVKEQEIEFMKSKMRDTIAEFEKAKENETEAEEHIQVLKDEIQKYKQEIQLLSSIGSSVQQVEINDVVRQLREKHAAETVSWKKQIAELQGHLRMYKRQQQLLVEDSFPERKADTKEMSCQTDVERVKSPLKSYQEVGAGDYTRRKEMTQIAIINSPNEDDLLIKEKKLISLNEKFEELKREFQEERDQKELEIQQYRERLARLPAELYQRWEETQRELGLQAFLDSKPICVDAFTSPMESEEVDLGPPPNVFQMPKPIVDLQDAQVQVDLPPVVEVKDVQVPPATPSNEKATSFNDSHTQVSPKNTSSVLIQTEKENSSEVNTQTDETLETFNVLGNLLESWHQELLDAKEHEKELTDKCEEYEEKCSEYQTALNKYHKQFKVLQKVATKCRKESKKREDIYKKEIADLKQHQREVLQKLNEKLNILT